ncbi:MAG: prepilin-type N-terminal cleavage/methylation domain-containing protein [Desulfuromusa sp.]|nr:prepilin-type N-terminal cleavage/methylation domain-containing protein [Desulfuromusa sp.]
MIYRHNILDKNSISEKGFTLVELMVVIAITAIIAGFTMAEINSTSHKLRSTAQTLRAKMQQAKLLAVKDGCNVFVDFDLDDGGAIDSFYMIWGESDEPPNKAYDGATELIEQVLLPNDISFGAVAKTDGGPTKSASNTGSTAPTSDGISFSGDSLRFSPQGTGSQGWAYLHAPNNDSAGTHAVGSNNAGRIQSRYWATNGSDWR